MSNKTAVIRKLEEIYASVPSVECKGLCGATNCGPVHGSRVENRYVEEETGGKLKFPIVIDKLAVPNCPHLTSEKRCSIYEARPLICRLFGVVDVQVMRCPHGCSPKKWLTHADANKLMEAVHSL